MDSSVNVKSVCMNAAEIDRAVTRMAHQILEANENLDNLVLVGIVTRGDVLAERIARAIEKIEGVRLPLGCLDISFYRDDVNRAIAPVLHATDIPFDINGKDIVLVDDVLYTGRTVRSALDALMDYGRPRTVQLAVMVDRGHRELPIRADYVGKNVPSSHDEDVRVCIAPLDDRSDVEIWDIDTEKNAGGAN